MSTTKVVSRALCATVVLFMSIGISMVANTSRLVRADFTPVPSAARLLDTRPGATTVDGLQAGQGVIEAETVVTVQVAGRAGIEADSSTAVLNVTVVDAQEPGFVTLFACDVSIPLASNANYVRGTTRAALVLVELDDSGAACVYVHGRTHLAIDVTGAFVAGDVANLAAPARMLDTRAGGETIDDAFAGTGPIRAGESMALPVGGRGGLTNEPSNVVLTLTVVDPLVAGWAVAFTCGSAPDPASTVNFVAGQTIANMAIARTDSDGEVCVLASADTHLVVDVTGQLAADVAELLPEPRRMLDTRADGRTIDGREVGIGVRAASAMTELQVAGRAGVPINAGSVILNVTAVAGLDPGFVTVYAGGTSRPGTSNLNFGPGDVVANAVMTQLAPAGQLCFFTSAATHLVVDVIGWLPGSPSEGESGCDSAPLFPTRRVVALYGNDTAAALGALGEQPPDQAAERVRQVAAPYAAGDRPVQGAFELIATIANSFPGQSGLYRTPSSDAHVQRYLDAATANGLLLVLDIQPGRGDFLTELQRYDRFLRMPNVHAALDPEWHVGPGQVPGQVVGQVDATVVNSVADYLAEIVAEEALPEKMLIVHQFQDRMLTNRHLLREPPGVALTIHMDGFGTQTQKLNTYAIVHSESPFSNGFKLFYDEDIDMFEPLEVLALEPVPDLITYQ